MKRFLRKDLRPEAVTFDCWGTLLVERDPGLAYARRVAAVARVAAELGAPVDPVAAQAALDAAWGRHLTLWQEEVASGSREMARWALAAIGIEDETGAGTLELAFAEASLESDVVALPGARDALERLAEAGVRRALVCDTGFSPGTVVRRLLDRQGLLEQLEVQVFSDEAGVPKPQRQVFDAALAGLELPGRAALHVGDLRRTDVAGGRGAGFATVRIRAHYDDPAALPEADAVADSYAELLEILDLG